MKVKNSEIWEAREPLQKLLGEKLPVKTSYALAKLATKLNEELKTIETVRVGLVKKYGTENKEGKGVEVLPSDENYPKFIAEAEELFAQEVEIVYKKVTLPETLVIEAETVMKLAPFIQMD